MYFCISNVYICLLSLFYVHGPSSGTNFEVGVEEARPEGPRAGDGVLGEGIASPSPPTRH